MCLLCGMSATHPSSRAGPDFCLAEAMPEERIALRGFHQHGHVTVRPNLPPPCSGPSSGRVYYGRHARMYTHSSANSDYSDYYYEMYSPPFGDFRKFKSLSRSLFKLKIAYIVLTLFVVLSIVAFILMNPTVSPFQAEEPPIRSICVLCEELTKLCGKADFIKDLRDLKKLDRCCFKKLMDIIPLIPECVQPDTSQGGTTLPGR